MKGNFLNRCISALLCLCLLAGLFSGLQVSGAQKIELVTAASMDNAILQAAQGLAAEIDALPTTGALRNGKVALYHFSQSADGANDMKNLRGKHYILREEGDGFYVLDGSWTGSDGNLPMRKVTVSDRPNLYYIASGVNPAMAFDFHYRGLASNGMPAYVLRFNNGRNLSIGTRYSGWPELYYVKGDTTADLAKAPTIRLDHPYGVGWMRISNATGTHGLR